MLSLSDLVNIIFIIIYLANKYIITRSVNEKIVYKNSNFEYFFLLYTL